MQKRKTTQIGMKMNAWMKKDGIKELKLQKMRKKKNDREENFFDTEINDQVQQVCTNRFAWIVKEQKNAITQKKEVGR